MLTLKFPRLGPGKSSLARLCRRPSAPDLGALAADGVHRRPGRVGARRPGGAHDPVRSARGGRLFRALSRRFAQGGPAVPPGLLQDKRRPLILG